ncbi:MAG: N-acetylglucosamine-6-phosphate deacetylase [Terriglobales bacterium]
MLAFTAGRLLTPNEIIDHAAMVVDEGRVLEIASRGDGQLPARATHVDFGDAVIAPGYVDLHIHGSGGFDVMDHRAEALPAIERVLARHGVTSYFPTTVTAPMESTLRALERLANSVEARERMSGRAIPLGIHLEGPFISHARRGVHPAENLLPARVETFERLWQAARGRIRMMTIAPELEGALEVIKSAAARGVCVSLGHSNADFAATQRAIDGGARHATHTFNAMRPLTHRDPGILGALLTDTRVSADIIADGIHLDPAIVKLVAQLKGRKLVLITDATAATGMPDGRYHLGPIEVDVKDGVCSLNGKLAGSVLTMDRAVRNLSQFAGWSVSEAVAAASRNPAHVARCIGKGVLSPGADADFLVLNQQGEVLRTFIAGVETLH